MQLTKTEATQLGLTMTAKEIAAHLTATKGQPITEAWVKSAFKQLNIATKSLRSKNPLVIVDDTPVLAANSTTLTPNEQEELYANND